MRRGAVGKHADLRDPSCLILEQPAESLPFRDETFDGVTILLALRFPWNTLVRGPLFCSR
jgi:ubiquinone/menaquinone biosynthesis C-methylase UbiE